MKLRDLAEKLGRELRGDGDVEVAGVGPLDGADASELSFVRSDAWAHLLATTRAAAVVVPEGVDTGARPSIVSPNPGLDFARAVSILLPPHRPAAGVHPTACVDPQAEVDSSASIGPLCSVGAGARIGPRSVLHAGVHVYPGVRIGADSTLHAGCVVREHTEIGDRVTLQPAVAVGGDGFGYAIDAQGGLQKVPQVGRVVIEDDVEIGAHTTVDRATLGVTRVRRGAKIDNLVMIAHNCDVGEDCVVVAQSGVAGSTKLGRGAILMAQVGVAGHLTIGERAFLAARSGVHRDIDAGARVFGAPPMEERRWHRVMSALGRLPEALRRLRAVEKRLGIGLAADPGEKP
ncbi:UDP-3-O-[3-hydroxymyristoyl] glucosamine N-acyltransferase [Myxococcaceae bacterium]|nr:UDP-3-O-[3-hydroxymyristoyl] glucosamine N-acyltransferase [Myxococcaceae bacterium]